MNWNGWIEILDATSYEPIFELPSMNSPSLTHSVLWSPDGKRLLVTGGSDEVGTASNPVTIWDGNTGELILSIVPYTGQVWWGTWSPDGSRIATGSTDDTVRVWNAITGDELLSLSVPNNWSASPEWSPDGLYLAVGASAFDSPTDSYIWRVWQSTDELVEYTRECCVFRHFTDEERRLFALARPS